MTGTVKWAPEWVHFIWECKNAGQANNQTVADLYARWPRGGKTFTAGGVKYVLAKYADPTHPTDKNGKLPKPAVQDAVANAPHYAVASPYDPSVHYHPTMNGSSQHVNSANPGQPMMAPYSSPSNLQYMPRDPTADGDFNYPNPPFYSHPQASFDGREHRQNPSASNSAGNASNPRYVDGDGKGSSHHGMYAGRQTNLSAYGQEYENPHTMTNPGLGQYSQQHRVPQPNTTQMQSATDGDMNQFMSIQSDQINNSYIQGRNLGEVGLRQGAPINPNHGTMQSVFAHPTPNILQSGPQIQQMFHHPPNTTGSSTNQGYEDNIARPADPIRGLRDTSSLVTGTTMYRKRNPSHQGTTGTHDPQSMLGHKKDMSNKGKGATTVSTSNRQAAPSAKTSGPQTAQPLLSSNLKRVRGEFDFPESDERPPLIFDLSAGPRANPPTSPPRPNSSKKIEAMRSQSGVKRQHQGEEPATSQVSASPDHGSNADRQSNPHKRQKITGVFTALEASTPRFESSKKGEIAAPQSGGKRKHQGEEPSNLQASAGADHSSNADQQSNPHKRQKLEEPKTMKMPAGGGQGTGMTGSQQPSLKGAMINAGDPQYITHTPQNKNMPLSQDTTQPPQSTAGPRLQLTQNQPMAQMRSIIFNVFDMASPTPPDYDAVALEKYKGSNKGRSPEQVMEEHLRMANSTAQRQGCALNPTQVDNMTRRMAEVREQAKKTLKSYLNAPQGSKQHQQSDTGSQAVARGLRQSAIPLAEQQSLYNTTQERIAQGSNGGGFGASTLKPPVWQQLSEHQQAPASSQKVGNTNLASQPSQRQTSSIPNTVAIPPACQATPSAQPTPRMNQAVKPTFPQGRVTGNGTGDIPKPPVNTTRPTSAPQQTQVDGNGVHHTQPATGNMHNPSIARSSTAPPSAPTHKLDQVVNGHAQGNAAPVQKSITPPTSAPNAGPFTGVNLPGTAQPSALQKSSLTLPTPAPNAGPSTAVYVPGNTQPSAVQNNSLTLPTPPAGRPMATNMPGSIQPLPSQQNISSQRSAADKPVNTSWTGQGAYNSPYAGNGQTGSPPTTGHNASAYPPAIMPDPRPAPAQSKTNGKPSHHAKNVAAVAKPGKAQNQGVKKPSPLSSFESNSNQISTSETVLLNTTGGPVPAEHGVFVHFADAVFREHFTFPSTAEGWMEKMNHVTKQYTFEKSGTTIYLERPTFLGGVTWPTIATDSEVTLPAGCVPPPPPPAPLATTSCLALPTPTGAVPQVQAAPVPTPTAISAEAKALEPASQPSAISTKLAPSSLSKGPRPKKPEYIPCIVNTPMPKPKPITLAEIKAIRARQAAATATATATSIATGSKSKQPEPRIPCIVNAPIPQSKSVTADEYQAALPKEAAGTATSISAQDGASKVADPVASAEAELDTEKGDDHDSLFGDDDDHNSLFNEDDVPAWAKVDDPVWPKNDDQYVDPENVHGLHWDPEDIGWNYMTGPTR